MDSSREDCLLIKLVVGEQTRHPKLKQLRYLLAKE
jgi:hypothetical protein